MANITFFSLLGADPKSVVCAFYKQGQCTKGDKCKFSHDLTLERKSEKRSMYVDARDEELEKGKTSLILNLLRFSSFNLNSSLSSLTPLISCLVFHHDIH